MAGGWHGSRARWDRACVQGRVAAWRCTQPNTITGTESIHQRRSRPSPWILSLALLDPATWTTGCWRLATGDWPLGRFLISLLTLLMILPAAQWVLTHGPGLSQPAGSHYNLPIFTAHSNISHKLSVKGLLPPAHMPARSAHSPRDEKGLSTKCRSKTTSLQLIRSAHCVQHSYLLLRHAAESWSTEIPRSGPVTDAPHTLSRLVVTSHTQVCASALHCPESTSPIPCPDASRHAGAVFRAHRFF